ncbi:MAG: TIR domain-containing protein [Thiohalocapsa sp. PB-PSB1]|jgi:hypothetical protein|nr:MAG: TIR domain-containing protein [Thiohalocapsa sp. PB-PSB1]
MKQPKYDIVISFAGEDRSTAESIASGLKQKGRAVFYDRYEEEQLWGKDLYAHLAQTYKDDAKYCLMLISQHYAVKTWPKHERKAAQARAFSAEREYILPLRLDDTEIDGLFDTVGYIDGRVKASDEIVALLEKKIRRFDEEQSVEGLNISETYAGLEPLLTSFGSDIGKTYGYFVGQRHSLERIAEAYPHLRSHVKLVEKMFSGKFGRALDAINALMTKNAPDAWDQIKYRWKVEGAAVLDSQELTESKALDFIEDVRGRSEGNIESPVLETLLLFQPGFQSKPEREFTEGYRFRFCSDGSGKAKGVAFCIEIPKTWQAQDANRPNIVKKFVNRNGRGTSSILIIVKELPLPGGEAISMTDIEDVLVQGGADEFLPKEFDCQEKGPIELEGFPGLWVRYTHSLTRVRATANAEVIMYALYLRDKLFILQGQTFLQIGAQKATNDEFAMYEKTFELVANSLVLEGVYQ